MSTKPTTPVTDANSKVSELNDPKTLAREFLTGATRSPVEGKYQYEGFLSPIVIQRFAEYMHVHRYQSDGRVRDADNWQKGIPKDSYLDSAWRHFMDWWLHHRGYPGKTSENLEESLCALMFNTMGYLHEILKEKDSQKSAIQATGEAGDWKRQESPGGVPYWFPKKSECPNFRNSSERVGF